MQVRARSVTSQWEPALYEGTKPIEPPHDLADYHFDKDLVDKAIERLQMLHAVAPEKPFFLYYVPGTAHAPHHAPKDWIGKFKGNSTKGGTNSAKRRSRGRNNSV
jgi:arylsulfatase A-like enzyme